MRDKVAEVREGPSILIYFEPLGQSLLNQGKVREALQSYRDLIAKHPKEAVHHLQIAEALLAAGMGEAARSQAQTAVKLEPNSALAEKTLASILEYDLVGRQFRPGSDYAGAEAAFRGAEKLDPDDKAIVANLAILLEYDRWGLRYGPAAKLKDSIAEYRKLKAEELAEMGLKANLAFVLFYAGEVAAAEEYARTLDPQPKVLLIACEAMLHGSQAGLTEARKIIESDEQFKGLVTSAGEMVAKLHNYPLAGELLDVGASGEDAADLAADATTFRKTKPHQELEFAQDAMGTAMKFYLSEHDLDLTLEQLRSVCSKNGVLGFALPWVLDRLHKDEREFISEKARIGLFPEVGFDMSFVRAQPKVQGNDAVGYKVTLFPSATYHTSIYVVKENGNYRVLATSWFPAATGLEILDRVNAGDLSGARALLDWMREDRHLAGGDDPLAGDAFPRFWTKGKEADATSMKLAAAAILTKRKETAAQGLTIFEAAMNSSPSDPQRTNINLALIEGYEALEKYDKVAPICLELIKQYPESRQVFNNGTFALRVLGKTDDADQLAEDRLSRIPDDLDAIRALSWNAIDRKDYAKAHALDKKIIDQGRGEPEEFNRIAWYSLFSGNVQAADVEYALRGAELSKNDFAMLHTLGCVYGATGRTKEAREVLLQAMDSINLDEPDGDFWYAFGIIAEQYGEREVAITDYSRAKKPDSEYDVAQSSYYLAQIRLRGLHASAEQPISSAKKN